MFTIVCGSPWVGLDLIDAGTDDQFGDGKSRSAAGITPLNEADVHRSLEGRLDSSNARRTEICAVRGDDTVRSSFFSPA